MLFLKRSRKPPPLSDADAVAAYQTTGDLTVLGDLYERHIDLVYAVCYKYLRDEEASKDAVMQLFEQLVTDLRRHPVQHFRNWLHSVARNYCLMQLRRQTPPGQPADTLADTDTGLDPALILNEPAADPDDDLDRLHAGLAALPDAQRQCLDLFYLQQKSYAEVAEITGYELKHVKSHLQNGRRTLKLRLQPR
jgi:RNA polymerase sigma factor (sigma-70 family)